MGQSLSRYLVSTLSILMISGSLHGAPEGTPFSDSPGNREAERQARKRQRLADARESRRAERTSGTMSSPSVAGGQKGRNQFSRGGVSAGETGSPTPERSRVGATEPQEAFREFLGSLSAAERPVVVRYVRGLQPQQRRELRDLLAPLGTDARKVKILELARSNRKPDSLEERRKRAGIPASPPLAPISITPRSPESATYRSSAVAGPGSSIPEPGAAAPGFTLERVGGGVVSLDSLRGKPVVLEFGSITCPVYRGKVSAMAELRRKYGERAQFLLVYTLEAHPQGSPSPFSDREWVPYKNHHDGQLKPQPASLEQRRGHAAEAVQRLGEIREIVLDSMDNGTWRAFGARANSAFVIGADGKVILAQEWADPEGIEAVLGTLTGAEKK